MNVLTFSVFCLCTYLYCFAVILFYVILLFCVIFIFVCTSVELLVPGESPIAVSSSSSSSSSSKNNNNNHLQIPEATSVT